VTRAARSQATYSTAQVREDLARLQTALRAALSGVSSLAGSRPVDIVAALDIDLKLAWKLARIAQSGDPFAVVRHLPGIAGWRIALEAAHRSGASKASLDAAMSAFQRAISSGTAWAGDRKAFDIMAAGLAAGSDLRIDVEHRRQLYHGGSYVWGVRAQLAFRADILGPAKNRRMLDCATIRGFAGVERMRADTAWLVEAPFVVDDRGTKPATTRIEPLSPSAPAGRGVAQLGPHFLPEFCSDPLPGFRPTPGTTLPRTLELADNEVGTEGRFTLFHGSVLRHVQPARRSARHHGIFQLYKQRTPAERAVFDLAVHRSVIASDAQAEAILYSDLNVRPSNFVHLAKDRIPAGIAVENLGLGLRRARLDALPRHAEILALGFERLGWDPSEFHLFRVDAPYPPVPSTLALELPLKD